MLNQSPSEHALPRLFRLVPAQKSRTDRINADAKTDRHGKHDILQGKNQRQRRHGILADHRHEHAVHNIIK
jgi:hypothetical protein